MPIMQRDWLDARKMCAMRWSGMVVRPWENVHMTKNDPDAVRIFCVRQLFQTRHPGKPTATDALIFFGWLQAHKPELLPKPKHGDPFQHLKVDLAGLLYE